MSLQEFFSPEDLAAWVYIIVTVVCSILFFRRQRQALLEQQRHFAAIEEQLAVLLRNTGAASAQPDPDRSASPEMREREA